MRWDVTYTHVFCARRRAARSVSHMFTRALTVCTQGKILSGWTTLLDLCVSSTAHILSQSSSVPWHPSVFVDWQYTNDRTVQLQWCCPHTSRCCFLAVLPALVQTMLSGGATRTRSDAATCVLPCDAARMSLGVATPLSAKFFETMLSTLAWISFRRCNPQAPGGATRTRHPFPCSSGSAPRTCPGRCLACVQCCLAGKRFSPVLALLLAGALTVSHTRLTLPRRQAFSRPWWWAHSGAAAIVQSGRVHVSIAILASDGGLKLLVELPHSASLLLPSLLAALSVITAFHAHVVAVLPANISGLCR